MNIATGGKYLSIITVNWLIKKCLKYTNQYLKDVTCYGPPKFPSKQISPQKCELSIKFISLYTVYMNSQLAIKLTLPKSSTCYIYSLYPNCQLAIKSTLPKSAIFYTNSLYPNCQPDKKIHST